MSNYGAVISEEDSEIFIFRTSLGEVWNNLQFLDLLHQRRFPSQGHPNEHDPMFVRLSVDSFFVRLPVGPFVGLGIRFRPILRRNNRLRHHRSSVRGHKFRSDISSRLSADTDDSTSKAEIENEM